MTLLTYHTLLLAVVFFGMLVMTSSSPISAVIYLVLTYLAGGGLFILLGHSFLGLALIVVYVGAITVIFLFTIFMINQQDQPGSTSTVLVLGLAFGLLATGTFLADSNVAYVFATDWTPLMATAGASTATHEINALGELIFTAQPLCLFLVAYLLLLVMVGVIKGNNV